MLMEMLKILLEGGNSVTTKISGNSMTPRIKSGEIITLNPIEWQKVRKMDIVFCKVKGNYCVHLVKATNIKRGCLIANNHGHINGWTKKVYGKYLKD